MNEHHASLTRTKPADDANGSTLSDPQGRNFIWDFENRLVQAVVPGTNGGTTTFKYDPFGRRIQKSGPLGTVSYLYDGSNIIEELDQSGNALARYTQGGLIDEPFSVLQGTTTSYYQTDGLGSITSLTSSAGSQPSNYVYDSFGKLTVSTGTLSNQFQYTARELDSEIDVYFYRARYYDQSIGRFLSEDPSGFRAGLNFFAYTNNSPVNATDPTGLRTQLCCRTVRDWRALGASHCFVVISGNPNVGGGGVTVFSLLANGPTVNNLRDLGPYMSGSASCQDVPCTQCREKTIANNASNPGASGGGNYRILGPNSNTYSRFLILSGGCIPPKDPPTWWAPGYYSPIADPRPHLGGR